MLWMPFWLFVPHHSPTRYLEDVRDFCGSESQTFKVFNVLKGLIGTAMVAASGHHSACYWDLFRSILHRGDGEIGSHAAHMLADPYQFAVTEFLSKLLNLLLLVFVFRFEIVYHDGLCFGEGKITDIASESLKVRVLSVEHVSFVSSTLHLQKDVFAQPVVEWLGDGRR